MLSIQASSTYHFGSFNFSANNGNGGVMDLIPGSVLVLVSLFLAQQIFNTKNLKKSTLMFGVNSK